MNKIHLPHLVGQHEFWLGLLVVALAVRLGVSTDEFLPLGNLMNVATSYTILGALACGLFAVLISDGIDISLPTMTVIAQYTIVSWVIGHGGNFALMLIIVTAAGLLLGLVSGFLAYWLRVPAIITTTATPNVYYDPLAYITKGTWLYSSPDWFMNDINWFPFTVADGHDCGLTLPLLCLMVVIISTTALMNHTRPGHQAYVMGGSHDTASHFGLNLLKLHFYVYDYTSILAGITTAVQTQITQSVTLSSLLGFELTMLATVVLGRTSMNGRRGTLTRALPGVVLLAFLQNGPTLLSVSSYRYTAFGGAIILVSVSVIAWNERRKLIREL